tara:strand:+ start:1170 stop:1577 length:408 start_codon:yes stop_codon:yes gene_type:complete
MILLAILSILPHDTAARERFEQIEIQQAYSWCGSERENGDIDYNLRLTFTQILFRRWDYERGEHVIEAWRMAKPGMVYGYSHAKQVHEIRWFDGEIERVVETRSLVHSAADFDSEVQERSTYPREWRRDLRRHTK